MLANPFVRNIKFILHSKKKSPGRTGGFKISEIIIILPQQM